MVSEVIAAIAVSGALTGAALNSIRAWYQSPETEKFSVKMFFGGLASGGMAALALINFQTLAADAGFIALFISNALLGVGTSTLLSKAHEATKPTEEVTVPPST